MVGITIRIEVNQTDGPVGFSFRRDQLSTDIIWGVFGKLSQSNSRFNALNTLIVMVLSVMKLLLFGRTSKDAIRVRADRLLTYPT